MHALCGLRRWSDLSLVSRTYGERCEVWMQKSLALHDAIHALTYVAINRDRLLALPADALETHLQKFPNPMRAAKLRSIVAEGFTAAVVTDAVKTVTETLPLIDGAAQTHDFLAGPEFSLADAAILPFIHRLELLTLDMLWFDPFPATRRWMKAARERPSFNAAIAGFHTPEALNKFASGGRIAGQELSRRFGPF